MKIKIIYQISIFLFVFSCDFIGVVSIDNKRDTNVPVELTFSDCISEIPDCFEEPGFFIRTDGSRYYYENNIDSYISFKDCKLILNIPAKTSFDLSNLLNQTTFSCIPELKKVKYGNEKGYLEISGEEVKNAFESKNGKTFILNIPEENIFINSRIEEKLNEEYK